MATTGLIGSRAVSSSVLAHGTDTAAGATMVDAVTTGDLALGAVSKVEGVILMGAAIFLVIMEALNFSELRVSTRGLRFAAVLGES